MTLAKQYDHFTFPGSVPRSFVGPLVLAGLAKGPIDLLGSADTGLGKQILGEWLCVHIGKIS